MSHRGLAGGLVTLAALVGCTFGRRTPEMHYYTLAVPGTAPPAAARLVAGTFTADEPYATARIAYRTSPYRLDYYIYHRWAADPRRMLAAAVRDYLERRAAPVGDIPVTLDGNIRRLEEVDEGDARFAALALDLTVNEGTRVLLARTYDETELVTGRTPEAVVAGLSRALGRILDRVAADVAATR